MDNFLGVKQQLLREEVHEQPQEANCTSEFKEEAVKLIREQRYSIAVAASAAIMTFADFWRPTIAVEFPADVTDKFMRHVPQIASDKGGEGSRAGCWLSGNDRLSLPQRHGQRLPVKGRPGY